MTQPTPIGAAFAKRETIASLVAKVNDLHQRERARWADRENAEARLKVAELDGDEAVIAKFRAAREEIADWHTLYNAKKEAAVELCLALGIEPATFKSLL